MDVCHGLESFGVLDGEDAGNKLTDDLVGIYRPKNAAVQAVTAVVTTNK
jgi:hypothetical protein